MVYSELANWNGSHPASASSSSKLVPHTFTKRAWNDEDLHAVGPSRLPRSISGANKAKELANAQGIYRDTTVAPERDNLGGSLSLWNIQASLLRNPHHRSYFSLSVQRVCPAMSWRCTWRIPVFPAHFLCNDSTDCRSCLIRSLSHPEAPHRRQTYLR